MEFFFAKMELNKEKITLGLISAPNKCVCCVCTTHINLPDTEADCWST